MHTPLPRARATRTLALTLLALIPMLAAVAPAGPGPVGPAPAAASTTVTPMIATGSEHACALMTDGTVRCWGRNHEGQLGNGVVDVEDFPNSIFSVNPNPVPVVGLSGVTVIESGSAHTCALLTDGTLRCWGNNGSGQLGDGSTTVRPSPVTVTGLSDVTALAAGNDHTCALLGDGTVWCWGNNSLGQLGDGTTTGRTTPVAVTGLSGATAISAGNAHTCALVTGGEVRCWGFNSSGQLGDGTKTGSTTPVAVLESGIDQASDPRLTGVTAVSAGGAHTCALTTASGGTVRCWGSGGNGRLGDGATAERLHPYGGVTQTASGGITAVSAGNQHTCALRGDRTVACWGAGGSGRLGVGDTSDRTVPTDVLLFEPVAQIASANVHTCALMADDGVRCWGSGSGGRLGDGETTSRTSPVLVLASGTAAASPVPFSVRVTVTVPVPDAPTVAVACAPGEVTVGTRVTCTITGGDPGIDILWRASTNPVIAEAGVTLDADGTGTFTFTVPPSAQGATLVVELVAWTAPVPLGVVGAGGAGGPVPTRVPAGEGPWSGDGALVALLGLVGMLAVAGARSSSAGRR